jgi:DNA (cytosine-5)-methyltransferase 1
MVAQQVKCATGDITHALTTRSAAEEDGTGRGTPLVPVAFHNRQDPDVSGDITHPLGAKDNGMAVAQPVELVAALTASGRGVERTGESRGQDPLVLATAMQVRRLTPVECERLQGFPDNYTNIPWRKKPEAPDGPRYKALGNSMAVPCMAWIGKRIAEVDRGD